MQSSLPLQGVLQAPQCSRLLYRSTQSPAHAMREGAQMHVEFAQPWAPLHWVPHPPQLVGSVRTSVQTLPHETWPKGQFRHALVEHTWLLPQTAPQRPQLSGSL